MLRREPLRTGKFLHEPACGTCTLLAVEYQVGKILLVLIPVQSQLKRFNGIATLCRYSNIGGNFVQVQCTSKFKRNEEFYAVFVILALECKQRPQTYVVYQRGSIVLLARSDLMVTQ